MSLVNLHASQGLKDYDCNGKYYIDCSGTEGMYDHYKSLIKKIFEDYSENCNMNSIFKVKSKITKLPHGTMIAEDIPWYSIKSNLDNMKSEVNKKLDNIESLINKNAGSPLTDE